MTQQEVADRAELSLGALRDVEQGRVTRPRAQTLRRLAEVLKLPAADLTDLAGSDRNSASGLRLLVLGQLSVLVDDVPVEPGSPRQRTLLGRLALSANALVEADELIETVWGMRPPPASRDLLQNRISRLRQRLGLGRSAAAAPALIARGGGYELAVTEDELDLLLFRRLARQARQLRDSSGGAAAYPPFRRAVDLWRGSPLAELDALRSCAHVAALELEWRAVVVECAVAAEVVGLDDEVVPVLRQATEADPLYEPAQARLMVALARTGQPAAALAVFDGLRQRLADELGIDPSTELQQLHRDIVRGELHGAGGSLAVGIGRPVPDVPAQLPPAVNGFVGRAAELMLLDDVLAGGPGPAVPIAVLSGTAGVGKTALAVHWAHRVRRSFPDGQLFADLRGFDWAEPATGADEVLRAFLDALGVPPDRMPAGREASVALYRSLVADRRLLIVLDNARDADQLQALLPGSAGCRVLVTSRNQLTGLVATTGACPVVLDLLPADDSRRLLANRLGDRRVAHEPAAVDEIVAACARLPLALAVVAARAAVQPQLPLSVLADQLRGSPGSLDPFDGGDPVSDVRGVFSWSYRTLSSPAARLFRFLGLYVGPDITVSAAASLAGVRVDRVRVLIAELVRVHLVQEHVPGRYAMHDLLRAYAGELVHTVDGEGVWKVAVRRLLDYYLHGADHADRVAYPNRDRIALPEPEPGVTAEVFASAESALSWLVAERPALVAAISSAAAAGYDRHAWQLAWALMMLFDRRAYWNDWASTHTVALESARRLGDPGAQAHIHRGLGRALSWLHREAEAQSHLERALDLFGQVADRNGQGRVLLALGLTVSRRGQHPEAVEHFRRALELYRAMGHREGQASALNILGWLLTTRLGDHAQALIHCRQALQLQRDLGDRRGEAHTLDSLGQVYGHLGRHAEAIVCYRHVLDYHAAHGERFFEADTLDRLGDEYLATGDRAAAGAAWRQAVEVLGELGRAEAEQVKAKLSGLA
ncbi:tetratricopeptide repeat protein [Dactylosporangium roseum]|uniref:Tetratricopeptide repeat protein n=1 Tax=Dactylosporangium roseum TaxID=47989 RepID=A0ABY5ZBF2_9ACTN|nr:BTAD domain-containing putative transcriptional regulator [Dactylosporangium roseum]UWZ39425.1 tetratricopeptide repeat protein [Dactylosporangium roseum]